MANQNLRKRRKPVTISRREAVHRLKAMIARIEEDVKIGLWAEATLEAANTILVAHPNRMWPGADAYRTIAQSLALNLAISLARLFDPGTRRMHPNKRDIASIPLIVRLLSQQRCQRLLIEHARGWTPQLEGFDETHARGCKRAISEALDAHADLNKTNGGRAATKKLREFRNYRLAHSMMTDMLKTLPTYNELFQLMDVAREVLEGAKLAIDGRSLDLKHSEEIYRAHADVFWTMALLGKSTDSAEAQE